MIKKYNKKYILENNLLSKEEFIFFCKNLITTLNIRCTTFHNSCLQIVLSSTKAKLAIIRDDIFPEHTIVYFIDQDQDEFFKKIKKLFKLRGFE